MSIKALLAARTKLKADAAINAFCTHRYGCLPKHLIGYKRVQNANDFPAICYVPVSSASPDSIGGMTKERISIVLGIHEPGMSDDIFDGILQLANLEDLVLACLDNGELAAGTMYLGDARITTDMGSRHPFWELEIAVTLASR